MADRVARVGGKSGWGWRATVALVLAFTIVRLVYQRWLSPWELVGDEAYYWVQGQHLDWCYNEKGALFPWLIRLSCSLFGDTQLAVRLPVLLGISAAALMIGRLTISVSRGTAIGACGLIATGLFLLSPAMQANAQISTQDGLLIPWTVAMTAVGLRLVRRWSANANTWGDWIAWWSLLGVGMHLRFSAPLLLTAPLCFAFFARRTLRFNGTLVWQQLAGVFAFLVLLAPIIIWNAHHGWPTFEHTAGHLGVGGDQTGRAAKGNLLIWLGGTLGGIAGAYGPALLLILWASFASIRERRQLSQQAWTDELWILCATWPSVGFFVLLSLTKPVIASWPLPSLVPALVLAGIYVDRHSLFSGLTRPWFRPVWVGTVVYGVAGALLLMFPNTLSYLPIVGAKLDDKIMSRIRGHAALAQQVQAVRDGVDHKGLPTPELSATYYDTASLLWFYLPDHPVVHVASHRPSTYDNWPDTRLDSPRVAGKSMLLIGKADTPWNTAMHFDRISPTSDKSIQLGENFEGRLPSHTAIARANFKEGE